MTTKIDELTETLNSYLEIYRDEMDMFNKIYLRARQDYLSKITSTINNYNIDRGINPYFIIRALLPYNQFPSLVNSDNWEQSNNSILSSNSANCKFTIAKTGDKCFFIKVITILSPTLYLSADCIIFDILNAIIFQKIRDAGSIFRNKIDKYIPKFIDANYSYLTYISPDLNDKWDYSLIANKTNEQSPLNFERRTLKDKIKLYKNDRYIYITEAISDNKSLGDVLEEIFNIILVKPLKTDEYDNEKEYIMKNDEGEDIKIKMIEIKENYKILIGLLNNIGGLYEFIENIGYYFGFLHNDLHLGNILCKIKDNVGELKLIDLGRVSFGFFCKNKSKEIEDELIYYIEKLDIAKIYLGKTTNEFLEMGNPVNDIYKSIFYYPNSRIDKRLFNENISYSSKDDNLYICLDLITLSLNLFIVFAIYNLVLDKTQISELYITDEIKNICEFIELCKGLIEIEFISKTIKINELSKMEITDKYYNIFNRINLKFNLIEVNDIFNKYREIYEILESYEIKIKEIFINILNCLLIMNLFIINGIKDGTEGIIKEGEKYKLIMNNNKLIHKYCQFYKTSKIENQLIAIKDLFKELNIDNKEYFLKNMSKYKLFKPYIKGIEISGGKLKLIKKYIGDKTKGSKTKTRGNIMEKIEKIKNKSSSRSKFILTNYLEEIRFYERENYEEKSKKEGSKKLNVNELYLMYTKIYNYKK